MDFNTLYDHLLPYLYIIYSMIINLEQLPDAFCDKPLNKRAKLPSSTISQKFHNRLYIPYMCPFVELILFILQINRYRYLHFM